MEKNFKYPSFHEKKNFPIFISCVKKNIEYGEITFFFNEKTTYQIMSFMKKHFAS